MLVVLAACSADPPVDGLIPVPTQAPKGIEIGPSACPGALLEGVLVADDQVGFVVEHVDGFVSSVVWPHGYIARDAESRQLLDGSGRMVARAGDHFSGGGGWLGPTDAAGFSGCGDFETSQAKTVR
jgi:hypothetical protein